MIEKIACVKYRSFISKFTYKNITDLTIYDKCIIETEEGVEFGNVLSFEEVEAEEVLEESKNKSSESGDNSKDKKYQAKSQAHYLVEKVKCGCACADSDKTDSACSCKSSGKNKIFKILRIATDKDIEQYETNEKDSKEAYRICKDRVIEHELDLKLVTAYYFLDRSKLLFEFTAKQRVDFRELVKDLAANFKTRIELKQIGVRDEAKSVGGCGSCGREICCNIIGSSFETITIKMAKEQNMPLSTNKISGQCGRLMCCLAYEYSTYLEIKKELPKIGTGVRFNNVDAIIRDINIISRKLFIETEDKRFLYVDIKEVEL